jgi:methionyl-tRNA formyltransferase
MAARDANVTNDYFQEISTLCREHGTPFFERGQPVTVSPDYAFAISWRWLIRDIPHLIVLHDSLLPKYRGFAPLPTALLNGEPVVGVTALWASDDFDRGDIVAQTQIAVTYPVKIQAVIERISHEYANIVVDLCTRLVAGTPVTGRPQDEKEASYSLWRDEEDYRIDWSADASYIKRFIDSLGEPYKGASSILDGRTVRIYDAEAEPDVAIECRHPGKVIFVQAGLPVVVCGAGLLRINDLRDDETGASLLPLRKFRSRLK